MLIPRSVSSFFNRRSEPLERDLNAGDVCRRIGLQRRHREVGRLDAVPDHAYFQRYQKQLQYWTGSGWTTEPTLNARWKAAAKPDTSSQNAATDASTAK